MALAHQPHASALVRCHIVPARRADRKSVHYSFTSVATVRSMTRVEIANRGDVESLVELEALLFAEDAGVHDPQADVTWPLREDADLPTGCLPTTARWFWLLDAPAPLSATSLGTRHGRNPTRQPVSFGVLRSMYVRSDAREKESGSDSPRRSSTRRTTRAASRCMSTATSRTRPPDACMNDRDSLRKASLTC